MKGLHLGEDELAWLVPQLDRLDPVDEAESAMRVSVRGKAAVKLDELRS